MASSKLGGSGKRAHLKAPEWVEPFFDVTRLSASNCVFTRPDGPMAALAAWGQNREVHGNLDGFLLEATVRPASRRAYYARAELVTKDILRSWRTTSARVHSLSPAVTCRRPHDRSHRGRPRVAGRAVRHRRRHYRLPGSGQPEGQLRNAFLISRLRALPAESVRHSRDALIAQRNQARAFAAGPTTIAAAPAPTRR